MKSATVRHLMASIQNDPLPELSRGWQGDGGQVDSHVSGGGRGTRTMSFYKQQNGSGKGR